ncbi:MAG: chorismate synthase [Oligoflexia bacterium]|nr:chorismate synthase [Oligoflexia bacterium]
MAANSFGTIFKITTWGESHGTAIGVVIDGCPAGLELDLQEVNQALALRAPGHNPYTSPRKESDQAEILSGIFKGKTTGAPISIQIKNSNYDSSKYEPIHSLLRPGHANFTYLEKYKIFDYRGGGRSSARETAARVAAGVVAKKILSRHHITTLAYLKQMGSISVSQVAIEAMGYPELCKQTQESPLFCPDKTATLHMIDLISKMKDEGDSIGGVVEFVAQNVPCGLGDPVYEKLSSKLAAAMMSIPAVKGFEIGSGFASASMQGHEHNDQFILEQETGLVKTKSNHAGGILGGISTGMPITGRLAFKPTSSIKKTQMTLTLDYQEARFSLPEGSKHDPCVAIRGVVVVDAMLSIVLADAILLNKGAVA